MPGLNVASFTDAWIETTKSLCVLFGRIVASFTDAWIETRKEEILGNPSLSHLLQMRGLKLYCRLSYCTSDWSHLLQMRGLKPLFKGAFERVFNVASFTGTTFIIFFARRLQD